LSDLLFFLISVAEGGRTPPPYPSLFIKPKQCLADSFEDIPITKIAQQSIDYEGELVSFVLGFIIYVTKSVD
jgi:2-keto-4-pentenoate hydratase/2-oxohepta-3-ene-1,7-dioic acid hydratase in catechol pathway